MPAGKATPTLPLEPYMTIKNWVDDREAKKIPTYSTPEIIQRLLLQFAADIIKDAKSIEALKELERIDGAFENAVKKIH